MRDGTREGSRLPIFNLSKDAVSQWLCYAVNMEAFVISTCKEIPRSPVCCASATSKHLPNDHHDAIILRKSSR